MGRYCAWRPKNLKWWSKSRSGEKRKEEEDGEKDEKNIMEERKIANEREFIIAIPCHASDFNIIKFDKLIQNISSRL